MAAIMGLSGSGKNTLRSSFRGSTSFRWHDQDRRPGHLPPVGQGAQVLLQRRAPETIFVSASLSESEPLGGEFQHRLT